MPGYAAPRDTISPALAGLVGAVYFELFGHRRNVIDDHETFFAEELRRLIGLVGLR